MSEHHVKASKMNKAEEVFDVVVFPASHESAEVVHSCEQPLHFPSSSMAPQLASVLILSLVSSPVGRDHLDAVLGGKLLVERGRVVGFVADGPGGELVEEAAGKNAFRKLALGRRSAFDSNGERKTITRGHSDYLRPLPAPRRTNGKAPFSRSQMWHSRTPHPDSACLAHAAARPATAEPLLTSRYAPTAGSGDGGSGTPDASLATHATAHPCPAPTAHRSAPLACHATGGHGYLPAEPRAAQARRSATVHRPTPSALPCGIRGIAHRAITECTNFSVQRFMRLVLGAKRVDCCKLSYQRGRTHHR